MEKYIIVHGGAGHLSSGSEKNIKHALRNACNKALESYEAISIAENAIIALENDPALNAGYGSNLTLEGVVECDASIMMNDSAFGSVGAVSGIKNPIHLARQVLEYAKKPDPLGRIPPMTLVSTGAHTFASDQADKELNVVISESLVSPRAKEIWRHWDTLLRSGSGTVPIADGDVDVMQDTVGAIAYDTTSIAAGVSSGGILLKLPGRVGQAAVYGAGCWAQSASQTSKIACSISGAGEEIVRSSLARAICTTYSYEISRSSNPGQEVDVDPHDVLYRIFDKEFWKPSRGRGILHPNAGAIVLIIDSLPENPSARLWCTFTTPSMAIAYMSSSDKKPKVEILRQPKQTTTDPPIFITAISL